jgi:hypothetical protein
VQNPIIHKRRPQRPHRTTNRAAPIPIALPSVLRRLALRLRFTPCLPRP